MALPDIFEEGIDVLGSKRIFTQHTMPEGLSIEDVSSNSNYLKPLKVSKNRKQIFQPKLLPKNEEVFISI